VLITQVHSSRSSHFYILCLFFALMTYKKKKKRMRCCYYCFCHRMHLFNPLISVFTPQHATKIFVSADEY
jgi:hypothetical protein